MLSWIRSRKNVNRQAAPRKSKKWRNWLFLEPLEERVLLSVAPLTLADPTLWGASGQGLSKAPSMSADGQLVVFESTADNITPNDTNNPARFSHNQDIFL